jgi:hypothetical protein
MDQDRAKRTRLKWLLPERSCISDPKIEAEKKIEIKIAQLGFEPSRVVCSQNGKREGLPCGDGSRSLSSHSNSY